MTNTKKDYTLELKLTKEQAGVLNIMMNITVKKIVENGKHVSPQELKGITRICEQFSNFLHLNDLCPDPNCSYHVKK